MGGSTTLETFVQHRLLSFVCSLPAFPSQFPRACATLQGEPRHGTQSPITSSCWVLAPASLSPGLLVLA